MEAIYRKARAKINLNLEVVGKRENGYHNLESVFQKISLYDEIYIRKTKTNICQIECNSPALETEENIIAKAYEKLKANYPQITGIEVNLNKKIPMQAGLAGGSADCATFLLAMNELFDLKMSRKEVEKIGQSLGADVVPCLYNGAVLGEGIGEKITPIHTNLRYYLVMIKPQISCNTGEMFAKIDARSDLHPLHKAKEIKKALEENDLQSLKGNLYNVFESVIQEKQTIQNLKEELLQNGAIESAMTGTGSCVYGIFEDKKQAKKVYQKLKEKQKVYIGTSYQSKKGEYYD